MSVSVCVSCVCLCMCLCLSLCVSVFACVSVFVFTFKNSSVPGLGCWTQTFQDSGSQITAATASGSSLNKSHRHQVKLKRHLWCFDYDDIDFLEGVK